MAKVVRVLGSLIATTVKAAAIAVSALAVGAAAWIGTRYVAFDEHPLEVIAPLVASLNGPPADASGNVDLVAAPVTRPEWAVSGPPVRVLFIGNSLTYFNDMPNTVARLAAAGGTNMEYDQHTPGGSKLVDHASNPQARAKIERGTWDFVVLQEQGQWPAFPDWQLRRETDPYANALRARVKLANPGATVALYMTMARRDGDSANAASIPEVGTYAGMQARINRTYERLGRELGATVVPVGRAWEIVRRARPSLNLYQNDGYHPSVIGSYLAACVFYATLFRQNPVGLSYTAALDLGTARYLQRVARDVAFR